MARQHYTRQKYLPWWKYIHSFSHWVRFWCTKKTLGGVCAVLSLLPTQTPTASKRSGPHYMNSDSELHTAQRHQETLHTSCFTKLHHPILGHSIRSVVKSCSASTVKVLLLSGKNTVNYTYTYITVISNLVISTCGALAMCKCTKL